MMVADLMCTYGAVIFCADFKPMPDFTSWGFQVHQIRQLQIFTIPTIEVRQAHDINISWLCST